MHAESSRRWLRILTVFISILALAGCGEGDGPTRIFGVAATPLPPGGGGNGGVPTLGVFSETNTDPAVSITDIQFAGNQVLIGQSGDRVFEGAVSLELLFTIGGAGFGGAIILFEDADLSTYNTLKFSIDTSSFANFANLTVQLEPPPGGTGGNSVSLSDYTPVATTGDWNTYEIPLAAFPSVNPALVNKLGFFNARDGGGVLLAGTLYLDDIHFTTVGGGGPDAGTPIDPEVVLYATDSDPDLVRPGDYDEITDLGSGSVIDESYAEDETYSPVVAVFSGTNDGANVARVGYTGFARGFAGAYGTLNFKVKGMPNSVIFVKLFDGVDTLRINLTSSAFSEALTGGWYQVSIPISSFNGVSLATGIVFESDNSALMQFRMLLTDIGFSGGGTGGPGPGGGTGLGVFSETNTASVVNVTDIVSAGNTVTISETSARAFDGTVSLELMYSDNSQNNFFGGAIFEFDDADLSAYDTLKFSIDTSSFANFANLTVQLEPPGGGTPGGNVSLAGYTPVATSGAWNTYEIPLADFTAVNLSLVNRLGFFNARDGADVLLAGTLYLDDIHFATAGGGNGGTGLGVFSETNTASVVNVTDIVSAGNTVTISETSARAFDGTVSLELMYSDNSQNNFFGGAIFEFDDADLSAYDTLKFSIDTSSFANFANLTVQLEPPGGGTPGGNVSLAGYTPVATSGAWNTYEIPLADFTAVNLSLVNRLGFFNARDGADVLLAGTLYLDDIHFTTASGGSGNALGIVPDGDFENGTLVDPPWKTFANNGVVEISDVEANGGTYSAHLLASGAGSFPILKVERLEEGNLTGGESVTVSFDAIAVDQQPGAVVFIAQLFTERSGVNTGASDEILIEPPTFLTDSWTTYSFNTMLGPDAGGGVSLLFKADCGGDPNCVLDAYIDNVSIVIN